MGRVYSDLATAKYGASGHPEAPFRVSKTHARLTSAGLSPRLPDQAATRADVELLHGPEHYDKVMKGTFQDADTPAYPGIGGIAMISLAGALSAAQSAAGGAPSFSLMRPPGHHAGRDRVSGFCYFNNLALACAKLQAEKKAKRIAILDIDVHHGDGTDELMTNKDGVLFISLHQSPLYPGSGLASHDNCRNFPLAPGTEEKGYLKKLDEALRLVQDHKPDLLAVSAGFDTYKDCPIAQLKLTKDSYRKIGKLLGELKLPRFAALEGGYAEVLPLLVENFLDGFFQ